MNRCKSSNAITLIALVVTIVVLLILAGVNIVILWGDHGILKTTQDATTKFGIEAEREKIDNVRIDWWTQKTTGEKVTIEDFFYMLKEADIIEDREQDVKGPDDNNTYTVETNSGYTVEIILDENGNVQIGDIEKGTLTPKIRDIKISTTENSITAKASVARAEGKTVTYEYKLETEADSGYKTMTATADGSYTATGLIANKTYTIKVTITPTEPLVEDTRTAIARNCSVTEITLDKTEETLEEGKTIQLTASIEPEYAEDKSITWTSSDDEVAEVSNKGLVTAKKVGTATITATANGGSNKEATSSIVVLEATSDWNLINRIAKAIAKDTEINNKSERATGKTELEEPYDIKIGDIFTVRYNNEIELKKARVIGFKHDELVEQEYGEGYILAGITFDFIDFIGSGYQSNSEGEMDNSYTKLSNCDVIKKVKKEYISKRTEIEDSLPKKEKFLWLLSEAEVNGYAQYGIQTEGRQYKYYNDDQQNPIDGKFEGRIKPVGVSGHWKWWLRTLYKNSLGDRCVVNGNGHVGTTSNNNSNGYSPGFCI